MKRVGFDTNIILDVLQAREPHFKASSAAWAAVEKGQADGLISAHALTTIYYLLHKELGSVKAAQIVSDLLKVFEVAPVNRAVIDDALKLSLPDFEDAVTATAAKLAGCELIVTREPKGFRGSPVRCLTPEALVPILETVAKISSKS